MKGDNTWYANKKSNTRGKVKEEKRKGIFTTTTPLPILLTLHLSEPRNILNHHIILSPLTLFLRGQYSSQEAEEEEKVENISFCEVSTISQKLTKSPYLPESVDPVCCSYESSNCVTCVSDNALTIFSSHKHSCVRWKSGKLKANTPLIHWKSGQMILQSWYLRKGWSYQPTIKIFVYLSDCIWYYSCTTKTCVI